MVNFKEDEQLKTLNHSCAHVMAQAIKHLYPQAKFWVGPVVAEGFYYDIDLGEDVIRDEDIEKITKEMKKVVKSGKKIIRREVSKEEALEMFADDPYKLDLIADLEEGNITVYDQGDFTDLCRGPHVDNVKLCKHFKLIRHSGAYWKGDSKNKMLQRIYGVCFPTAEELEAHLQLLEEAKERDHRKIGKDMNLFMVDDLVGRGLPMFLPKGYTIWQELENYIKEKERKLGYLHVMTPCVGTVNLYKTSGHWDHYKENMFPPMEMEGESFVLRPMNCPHHMMIYANKRHSYKNLPIRIGEIAHDFRYESSGTLKGIERGRHFCQNDAHLFVTPEQIKDEFTKVVELIFSTYKDFGITNYRCVLSLRDPENKEKYHDDDEMWNTAEDALRDVMNSIGIEYTEEIGEAAFYGPKLDVNVQPAIGNEITLSTCQLDFCLPAKFNLSYIDSNGEKQTPVVLHRAILGSLDRFMAYILEETKGNLPTWLAPVQARVMPVKTDDEGLNAYAQEIVDALEAADVRVELDDRAEKLGYRMREGQVEKVPYLLVVGFNEKDQPQYRMARETASLHGAAMMVPRHVLQQIGPMTEVYFLFYEEFDWSARMHRAGYKLWYEPAAVVYHKESMTARKGTPLREFYLSRARILYARRNISGGKKILSCLYLSLIAAPKKAVMYLLHGKCRLTISVLHGTLQGLITSKL